MRVKPTAIIGKYALTDNISCALRRIDALTVQNSPAYTVALKFLAGYLFLPFSCSE